MGSKWLYHLKGVKNLSDDEWISFCYCVSCNVKQKHTCMHLCSLHHSKLRKHYNGFQVHTKCPLHLGEQRNNTVGVNKYGHDSARNQLKQDKLNHFKMKCIQAIGLKQKELKRLSLYILYIPNKIWVFCRDARCMICIA